MLRFPFKVRCLRLEDDLLVFFIKPEDGFKLPEIMKWMKQVFAQRFNLASGRTGHIWGDRYWSQVVEGEPEERGVAYGDRPWWRRLVNGVRPRRRREAGKPSFFLKQPLSLLISPG
jgi:hypothetical protein